MLLWICCLGYLSELLLLCYFVRSSHYDRDHTAKLELERECDRSMKYLPVLTLTYVSGIFPLSSPATAGNAILYYLLVFVLSFYNSSLITI